MQLPQDFIDKYNHLLGSEAQAFFESFEQDPISGFRVNPLKENQLDFEQPIPDMPWSYYGKVSGKSPEHVTGLVYSQEPAAQVVGQVASPEKGMKVLDLAAAPGGKSTHLLSYLDNTGLLVSNEISSKRAKILAENIERFGARNVVVTNESADRLTKVFPAYFDMIVLDAPCSGEGMFRKDPAAIQYWSKEYPAQCASLQREILESALEMLAPEGQLVYSTCTWSPEENEEIVAWLLDNYELELVAIPKINGMTEGIGYPQTARMYPHHFAGEGQFVAKFRYIGEAKQKKLKPGKSNLNREQQALWKEFEQQHLTVQLTGLLQVFGENLYLLPDGLPDLSNVKIARNGLHLGTFKKKRFEPSFALGLALHSGEVRNRVDISLDDFPAYVSGQTVAVSKDLPNGWYQVAVQGNGLGFAKIVSGTLKNAFPKGLRF
ncbi:RsmF rRNA methyltransferase first C-terminal domain-containing protein [Streptococcus suis]|uniref:RsmF rRNA methyltransferase first C-terminal domain-containing protein n=1 Tax=Streptococcus suis TaxID=1307 RepID=UPI002FCB778F